jgi:probable rRNA maturation factor
VSPRKINCIEVEIANGQDLLPIDEQRLQKAVAIIFQDAGRAAARISVAVVDDVTIARLNEQFLAHEGPTDVLSFPLEETDGMLEGEIVASAETALREAPGYGWSPEEELLLYVIHGALHLAGFDDQDDASREEMRRREKEIMERIENCEKK